VERTIIFEVTFITLNTHVFYRSPIIGGGEEEEEEEEEVVGNDVRLLRNRERGGKEKERVTREIRVRNFFPCVRAQSKCGTVTDVDVSDQLRD